VAEANEGEVLGKGVKHDSPENADGLEALVRNAEAPIWRRRLALNWLAEDYPGNATSVLRDILKSESQRSLFRSAIANAGMLKSREAAAPLAALLAATSDRGLTLLSLESLGRIGDDTVATSIRPLVDHKDVEISRAAMLALGALRDGQSTARLLEVFSRSKEYRPAWAAARAIVDIAEPAAIDKLFATLADPKAVVLQRQGVADALTPKVAGTRLAELAVVLAAPDIPYGLASDVAEAIGRAGTPAALDTLRGLVDTTKPQTADLVVRAMTRKDDPAWRNAVIAIAGSNVSRLRGKAIYYLGLFEVRAALPALREAAVSADPEIRKAACSALDSLKDATPTSCDAKKAP
jgi:HEAT repeat protein